MMNWIVSGAVALNLFAFLLYAADKRRALCGQWRVSERALLTAAALFGAAGALLSMCLFRHKIRKPKFTVYVPLLLLVQAAAFFWALSRF